MWQGTNNVLELTFALHKAREQVWALASTGKALSNAHAQTAAVLRNRCTESPSGDDDLSQHHLLCKDVYRVAQQLIEPSIFTSVYNKVSSALQLASRHVSYQLFGGAAVNLYAVDAVDGVLKCDDLRRFAQPMQSHLNALNNSVASGHYSTTILLAKQLAICEELDEEGTISAMVKDNKKKKVSLSSIYKHTHTRYFSYVFDFRAVFNRFHHIDTMNSEEEKELKAFVADLVAKAKTVQNVLNPRMSTEL